MEILSFENFKLILEAEGDLNAGTPPAGAETPPPTDAPAPDLGAPASLDLGAPPPMGGDLGAPALPPDPNAPIQTGPPPIRMAFLDPSEPWHSEYSNGGGVKRFTEYEISQADLDKWITDSKLDAKKEEFMKAVSAKEPMARDLYDKLKSDFIAKKIGVNKGDIDIEYDNKKIPSTSNLEVNFIKPK